jgi:hypothetical protein
MKTQSDEKTSPARPPLNERSMVWGHEIIMEDDFLRVVVDPDMGGKIRSFQSKSTGTEYFYLDRRADFSRIGYSAHDISGLDECFPAVADCTFPEGPFRNERTGDHGLLWNRTWDASQEDGLLVASCELENMGLLFQRECRLNGTGGFELSYTICNESGGILPYVYAAHLMLALDPDTRVILPGEMTRVYTYASINYPIYEAGKWLDAATQIRSGLKEGFSAEKKSAVKCFTNRLSRGHCGVHHGGIGERLDIEFEARELPYLGIMISEGFGPGGECDGEMILGLEPTTSIGDELKTSQLTGTTACLEDGCEKCFWIRLSLREDATLLKKGSS